MEKLLKVDGSKTYMVYCHTNINNGKRYVGISHLKTYQRWGKNGNGYKKCTLFYRAINKYGWDGFTHEVLHEGLSKEEAENLEIKYIADWKLTNTKYGYNLREGGNTNLPSEATRLKQSNSIRKYYKNNPEARKEMSNISKSYFSNPENREKSSKRALKMYSERPEIKDKIRNTVKSNYEKHPEILERMKIGWERRKADPDFKKQCRERTLKAYKEHPELKQKLSEAHKGQGAKPVFCTELNKEFSSIKVASQETNTNYSSIRAVLKGIQHTAGGYHWEYIESEWE